MEFEHFSFSSIRIDGVTRDYDVVIDGGEIRKRKKQPSKQFRDEFGQTTLSIKENIPWKCRRLVVGTGAYGRLPVMKEVKREANASMAWGLWTTSNSTLRRLEQDAEEKNAILHVTC